MITQHRGKIVSSHKASTNIWYSGNRVAPGVNFRTDFMKQEQIAAESGTCHTIILSKSEIEEAFERARKKYRK